MQENNGKEQQISREYEANTIEEAIEKAHNDFYLSKEKIKIQILTEGKKGLFGKEGKKKAKIRATVLQDKDPTSEDVPRGTEENNLPPNAHNDQNTLSSGL